MVSNTFRGHGANRKLHTLLKGFIGFVGIGGVES